MRGRVLAKATPGGTFPPQPRLHPHLALARQFVRWIETTWPADTTPLRATRHAETVFSRHLCWYVMRELWGIEYRFITQAFGGDKSGVRFGRWDHSSIIYAVQKVRSHPDMVRQAKEIAYAFERRNS